VFELDLLVASASVIVQFIRYSSCCVQKLSTF
jgi:hypothetical protein